MKTVKLAFFLSMPGVPSWNGRWTGEGQLYCRVENLGRSQKAMTKATRIVAEAPYLYRWNDGWAAEVDVKWVDPRKSRRLVKQSRGFCGYDWMITSILSHGKITT
jgi:hypothetical protein